MVFDKFVYKMKIVIDKLIYWSPRILGAIFILFLMMFSLDIFMPGLSAGQKAVGLFVHNIPALVLLVILIISWKREIVGGVVFVLVGIIYLLMQIMNPAFEWYQLPWSFIIAGPALLIGVLFIISRDRKRYQGLCRKKNDKND